MALGPLLILQILIISFLFLFVEFEFMFIAIHLFLVFFFTKILKIDNEEAEINACRIEHVITQKAFDKIKTLIQNADEIYTKK